MNDVQRIKDIGAIPVVRPFGDIPDLNDVPWSPDFIYARDFEQCFRQSGATLAFGVLCSFIDIGPDCVHEMIHPVNNAQYDSLIYLRAPNIITCIEGPGYVHPAMIVGYGYDRDDVYKILFFSTLYPAHAVDEQFKKRDSVTQSVVANTTEGFRKYRIVPSDRPLDYPYQRRDVVRGCNGPL